MSRFLFYISFFIFISVVFSDPSLPLRGTSRAAQEEPLPANVKTSTTTASTKSTQLNKTENQDNTKKTDANSGKSSDANKVKTVEKQIEVTEKQEKPQVQETASNVSSTKNSQNIDSNKEQPTETSSISSNQVVRSDGQDNEHSADTSKCSNSFVMWFANGVAITTISCGEYSAIYSGDRDGSPETRYISGEVTTVEIESESSIKINNQQLSSISTEVGKPTPSGGVGALSAEKRSLVATDGETVQNVKVYTFPAGGKNFEVQLPNKEEASERKEYSLVYNGKVLYSGSESKSEYSFKDNGDLVNSSGQVVLEGDSSSSAFKAIYTIPSLIAAITSMLLF